MNLKNQLKYYLKTKNLTPSRLAQKAGISKQVLSLWLSGTEPKKISQIKRVADLLGISVDHLYFGNGEAPDLKKNLQMDNLCDNGWICGLFEIRFRRVK